MAYRNIPKIHYLCVMAMICLLTSCSWILDHPDSYIEELAEELIEEETGVKVDFTPSHSSEVDKRQVSYLIYQF